jgi:hypothetical protein
MFVVLRRDIRTVLRAAHIDQLQWNKEHDEGILTGSQLQFLERTKSRASAQRRGSLGSSKLDVNDTISVATHHLISSNSKHMMKSRQR